MEDKIKKIIAVFLQKEPSEINPATLINSTVIPGSILIHMMYRELTLAGFPVKKYMDIKTYGELINRINGTPVEPIIQPVQISVPATGSNSDLEIGIDIESISNFPAVNDYREDPFYKTNFTNNEISYCILKPSPVESFAGLFCIKEAICKTNENFRKIPFNQIEIVHTAEGKPEFRGYALSVSHTNNAAVGVAILKNDVKTATVNPIPENKEKLVSPPKSVPSGNKLAIRLFILALLLAVATIIFEVLYKK